MPSWSIPTQSSLADAVRAGLPDRRRGALWRVWPAAWRSFSGRRARPGCWSLRSAMARAEWLRGHLFTGFPWNLPAYGWGASLALLQSACADGGLWACLSSQFCWARRWRSYSPGAGAPQLPLALIFAALWSYGVYRLANTPMQRCAGCISCAWCSPIFRRRKNTCRRLIAAQLAAADGSQRYSPASPHIIIWPEAATGFPVRALVRRRWTRSAF